eukprot:TRINITY_DN25452_c0_g1_i1.p1 TRINITY_DN25452_c0_g1~~TRINITY_DN25452_c0_g1_i1.p1  ORF type:complete len:529 (-),score=68.87 TRINITY_DN25452_c0_g1_i1:779-2365(-)
MAKCSAFNTNFYDVLQVEISATFSDIRTAYRRAALATHPDKGGSADQFLSVTRAFETLACESSRALYDRKWRNRFGIVHGVRAAGSASEFEARFSGSYSQSVNAASGRAEAQHVGSAEPSCGDSGPVNCGPRKRARKVWSSETARKEASDVKKLLHVAFQRLRFTLQQLSVTKRQAAIEGLQQHVRLRFLQFMESSKNKPCENDEVASWALVPFEDSSSSDSDDVDFKSEVFESSDITEGQNRVALSDSTPSPLKGWAEDHVTDEGGSDKRRLLKGVVSLPNAYYAQLMFGFLLCRTKSIQNVDVAVELYILLVQIRNAAAQEASSRGMSLREMTDGTPIREAFDKVLSETNNSVDKIGLQFAVRMDMGSGSTRRVIMSPIFSLEDALVWRNRLMVARATSWDALSAAWVELLQHSAFRHKRPLSVEEATEFVEACRSDMAPSLERRHAQQSRTRQSVEQRLESRLLRAIRAVERAIDNEADVVRRAALHVSRAKRKREQERWRWFRRLPARDMTLEDIMARPPSHLQ